MAQPFAIYKTYEEHQEKFQKWVTTWKQWFKSPTLRTIYHFNKSFFSNKTLYFIDNFIIGNESRNDFFKHLNESY